MGVCPSSDGSFTALLCRLVPLRFAHKHDPLIGLRLLGQCPREPVEESATVLAGHGALLGELAVGSAAKGFGFSGEPFVEVRAEYFGVLRVEVAADDLLPEDPQLVEHRLVQGAPFMVARQLVQTMRIGSQADDPVEILLDRVELHLAGVQDSLR